MSAYFRQDMPPPGGYAPVKWARVGQKTIMNGYIAAGLYALTVIYGVNRVVNWKQYLKKLEVEKFDSFVAMEPFIHAERDRKFLLNLRMIRDEERELMKDHPGWVTGTLYGEPIYKTIGKDELPDLKLFSMYAHRPFFTTYDYCWPDQWA